MYMYMYMYMHVPGRFSFMRSVSINTTFIAAHAKG